MNTPMKFKGLALFLLLSLKLSAQNPIFQPTFPELEISPSLLSYETTLSLQNSTDSPVTFVLGQNHCVIDPPASFTVEAHGSWSQTFTQKHWDTGLDNCYGSNHSLIYQHSTDPNTRFGLEQSNSSNDPTCLGIKIFVVFMMGQTICPLATGHITGPESTLTRGGVYTTCPDAVQDCRDQVGRTMLFGFELSK